jgi:hypothetical protein
MRQRILQYVVLIAIGFSAVAAGGCSKDPVIPESDIPDIPPATRTPAGEGEGESGAESFPVAPPS